MKRIVRLDNLFAIFVKHLAFAREAEFFFAPFDQQRLELALERTDLLADGRLSDIVDLGCAGETFRLGEITEDFQTLDLHVSINAQSSIMSTYDAAVTLREV